MTDPAATIEPRHADGGISEARRYARLRKLEDWLEVPVLVLGLLWLVFMIVEFVWGLGPWLDTFVLIVWIIFVIDFLAKFALAPRKLPFLKRNWLVAIALTLPALRVFRVAHAVRVLRLAGVTRGIRVVRVVSTLNRAVKALSGLTGRGG